MFLFTFRPRRERMSLFTNGVIPQRHSRVRSLGSDCLPEQQKTDDGKKETADDHKSSLLSTSTRSTAIDSPPPRSLSFPSNLPDIADKSAVTSVTVVGAMDNHAFNNDVGCTEYEAGEPNYHSEGSLTGTRHNYGTIQSLKTPRVTITTDEDTACTSINEQWHLTNNEIKNNISSLPGEDKRSTQTPSPTRNGALTPIDG